MIQFNAIILLLLSSVILVDRAHSDIIVTTTDGINITMQAVQIIYRGKVPNTNNFLNSKRSTFKILLTRPQRLLYINISHADSPSLRVSDPTTASVTTTLEDVAGKFLFLQSDNAAEKEIFDAQKMDCVGVILASLQST